MITGVWIGVNVRKAPLIRPMPVLDLADVAAGMASVVLGVALVDLSVPVVRFPDDHKAQYRL